MEPTKNKAEFPLHDLIQEVLLAEARIRGYIRETPLEHSRLLSDMTGGSVFLKLENQQTTGSFKARGVFNKLLATDRTTLSRGVVTASTGNHGAAFAYAAERLGVHGTVYAPETISPAKLNAMESLGIRPVFHGRDTEETETFARETALREGKLFISPYNDRQVIGGQGTAALEIERQADGIDTVLTPVGGGGLAAGIAGYLKTKHPAIHIIGCQPIHSPVMAESVKAGRIIQMPSLPTLADGTAGGIERNSITFDICRQCLDGFFLLTEEEIAAAILFFLDTFQLLVEGAAALPLAAFLKEMSRFEGRTTVLMITGKKIALESVKKIICT